MHVVLVDSQISGIEEKDARVFIEFSGEVYLRNFVIKKQYQCDVHVLLLTSFFRTKGAFYGRKRRNSNLANTFQWLLAFKKAVLGICPKILVIGEPGKALVKSFPL